MRWTAEEIKYLEDNVGILTYEEIADHIGRTMYAVRIKAERSGLSNNRKRWTAEEEQYLEEHYGNLRVSILSKRLGHSPKSIYRKAYDMGYVMQMNIDGITLTAAANLLGKTPSSIQYLLVTKKIKSIKRCKYRIIQEEELCRWMRANPDKWDAVKCDRSFFQIYPWFMEKLDEDFHKLIKSRWGEDAV